MSGFAASGSARFGSRGVSDSLSLDALAFPPDEFSRTSTRCFAGGRFDHMYFPTHNLTKPREAERGAERLTTHEQKKSRIIHRDSL